jgi:hypothetical protein
MQEHIIERCYNCGCDLNETDIYYANVYGGHFTETFCDEDCHQAHLDCERLSFGS